MTRVEKRVRRARQPEVTQHETNKIVHDQVLIESFSWTPRNTRDAIDAVMGWRERRDARGARATIFKPGLGC